LKMRVADGSVVWKVDVVKDHAGQVAEYGMASSPLLADGMVIVMVGAPNATVAAYDTESGKRKWNAGTNDAAGYSTPIAAAIGSQAGVVAVTGDSVLFIKRDDGMVLHRHPYVTDYKCNTACAVAVDANHFVISSGENHGSVMLAIDNTTGTLSARWSAIGPQAEFRSEWQTPILLGKYLYAFDNVGSAGSVTHLTCIDATTGKPVWQEKRFGKGNHIFADGKLWMTTMKGEVVIGRPSPKGFAELSRARVMGMTRQAPALSDGRLYVRDETKIICIAVK
ncbi:MAG: PQQ-binding-like beta-propeller repeat protein, partial [Planctomycetota bacterium]